MVLLLPFLSVFLLAGQTLARHGFAHDQEYTYDWRGRIVGGITEISHRLAGLGFYAKVSVVPEGSNKLVCHITEFHKAEINEEFDHALDPFEEYHTVDHASTDLPEDVLTLIKHPFTVVMEDDGRVLEMMFSHEDPEWLRNVKKAFIGAFNMNLYGQEDVHHKEAVDMPLHYTVMEESVIGTCETAYSISPIADYMMHHRDNVHIQNLDNPDEHFVITKTLNFSHCITDNAWRHVSPGVENCHHGEGDCTNKEARTTSEMYIVQGDRHEFVIQYANIHGDYYFRPIGHDHEQTFDVISVMEISLRDVKPVSNHVTVPHPEIVTSLNAHYKEHMHRRHSLTESPLREMTHFMHNEELGSEFYNNVHTVLDKIHNHEIETTAALQSLAFSFQQMHLHEMKMLWEKISGHELTTSKYRTAQYTNPWTEHGMHLTTNNDHITYEPETKDKINVVLDVLAMTGTNPSVVFLGNLITNGELTAERAAQALMALPLTMNTPTIEVLHELLELLKTDFVHDHEQTLGAGMLALSNIIHNYCINDHYRETSYPDSEQTHHCHPHHPFILHEVIPFLAKETTSYTLTIQKLMALGNLGMVETLPILEPYARGEVTDDVNLRQTAVYALTKLSETHPHLVVEEAMPIFQNRMDHYEVRQAALMVVLATDPCPTIWKEIASSTWFEPSHQVQNYVYSIFDALVHNKFETPYFNDLKSKAKVAIHLAKPAHHGNEYSHFKMFSNMINEIHEGVLLDVDSLGNQNGLVPIAKYFKLRELFGGKEYTDFEYKIFLEGAVHAAQNALGLHHHLDHKQPLTAVWFKLLNNMERFMPLEHIVEGFGGQSLEEFFRTLTTVNKGININFRKALPGADVKMVLPTEVGLPLYINAHFPKYLDIHGNLKGSFSDLPNVNLNTGLQIDVEHEFLFNAFVISPISHNMVGAGIKINTEVHLPLNLNLQINLMKPDTHDKSLKLTWTVPNTNKPLWSHDVVPYTFNKKFDYLPFTLKENQMSIIKQHETEYTEEQHYGKSLFGLDIVAKVESDKTHMSHGYMKDSFNNHNWLSVLTDFYVPTSWHNTHYRVNLHHDTSTTNTVKADLKYTTPFNLEMSANLEGAETHTYHANLHYESDEFHISTKNLTFKLHQTHPNHEVHDFTFDASVTFPEIDMTKRSEIYNQDLTTRGRGQITYGPSSSTKHQINWRVKAEQTPEMKTFALNTPDKIHCDRDESTEHMKYSHKCLNALYHATTLNKKTVDIVYEDAELPHFVYDYAHYLLSLAEVRFHNYEINDHTVTHKPGHLTISVEHCPKKEVWDIEVIRPHESIMFHHVPELPRWMEPMVKGLVEHPINYLTYEETHDTYSTPYCIAQGNRITTFDNVTYSTSKGINTNCWYTVAKHCHDSSSHTEVMLQHNNQGIHVKVLLDDTHYVMLQNENGHAIMNVNGEAKNLPNNEKITVDIPVSGRPSPVHLDAGKIYSSLTVLDFTNLGFKILHDGSAAGMEVHHLHKNKLCGLCGNFNGEPDDDMYTSQDCVHDSQEQFVSSWVHPSDTCHPPAHFENHCTKPHAMSTVEATVHVKRQPHHEHQEDGCTHVQQVVEYFDHKICISTEKIPVCGMHCTALHPTVINTSFYCGESNEEMKNLAKQVHEGHYVDIHKHHMTYMDVTHPNVCVKHEL